MKLSSITPPFFLIVFLFSLFFSSGESGPDPKQATQTQNFPSPSVTTIPSEISLAPKSNLLQAVVIKVIDGDTMDLTVNGKKETVRLIGIDTPETVDPRKSVQCFGKEASDKARKLLTGQTVSLESDSTQGERDRYNRLLVYVFLEDKTNFNKLMIQEGYAHEYTYQSNPYNYQAEFQQAQRDAQDNKRGLWADDACSISLSPTESIPPVSGTYACNCSKTCTQIKTCDEANFQLNNCGCTVRDADDDGIPCESLCSN